MRLEEIIVIWTIFNFYLLYLYFRILMDTVNYTSVAIPNRENNYS